MDELKTENDVDFVIVQEDNPDKFRVRVVYYLDIGYGIVNSFYIDREGMMPLYIAYLAKTGNMGEMMGKLFIDMKETMSQQSQDQFQ